MVYVLYGVCVSLYSSFLLMMLRLLKGLKCKCLLAQESYCYFVAHIRTLISV